MTLGAGSAAPNTSGGAKRATARRATARLGTRCRPARPTSAARSPPAARGAASRGANHMVVLAYLKRDKGQLADFELEATLDHRGATGRPQQSRCSWTGSVEPAAHTRSTLPREHTHTHRRPKCQEGRHQYETSEGHGRRENIPSRGQRKPSHPLLAQCPPLCVADWGTLSCAVRASGGGGQSHLSCVRVGSVSSLGGGQEAKNI